MTIEGITEAMQDSMVLETKAINKEVVFQTIILVSTSLTINNKNKSLSNYGNRFNQP